MKEFNTIGVCIPSKHYMVDITDRVKEIKKIVDAGKYFVINRARQYGKTTTLDALEKVLLDDYCVLSLDFQGISGAGFRSEEAFVKAFSRNVIKKAEAAGISSNVVNELKEYITRKEDEAVLDELFSSLNEWCEESSKPIVMIIDEVDSATNNQVFLDFLAQLRLQYLEREKHSDYKTFRSVILAGVTDVKHLKSKIRTEDQHKVNSPFNIAADFNIDMRLPEDGIKEMLDEYNSDHHTDMNTGKIAAKIWEYTNGYPYLVSRICQIIDTRLVPDVFSLCEAWTEYGVEEAVKSLLSETDNPLFESLTGMLINYPELKGKLRNILLRGETLAWLPYDEEQKQLFMYGFIRNNHNTVAVFNRIFEMLLYIHFIGESDKNNDLKQMASEIKSAFVDSDGWLDVPKIMDHFIKEHNRIHKENTEKFLEEEGRERFITYVSAIINGTGTYDIEPQTRDHKRMDLVIHYLGRRYIVELKIWRGDRYNEKGEQQIKEYLDYWNLDTGYMLSFNFNQKKEPGVRRVHVGDKVVFEGMV
ncbi:MAG: AAA-like domain-containing protein [Lachnospiraceae bacterium]|nr:AAA-like domain-containing protein [Lachnospiraceae bacterium]